MSKVRILLRVHNLKKKKNKSGARQLMQDSFFFGVSTYLILMVSARIKASCDILYCRFVSSSKEKGDIFIFVKLFNIRTNFKT